MLTTGQRIGQEIDQWLLRAGRWGGHWLLRDLGFPLVGGNMFQNETVTMAVESREQIIGTNKNSAVNSTCQMVNCVSYVSAKQFKN